MKKIYQFVSNYLILIIALSVAAGFIYMLSYQLNSYPISDWDESVYRKIATESMENHNYLSFTRYDKAWFEKPPIALWLLMASYKIFGVTDVAGRVVTILFATAIVALSMYWAWRIKPTYLTPLLVSGVYFLLYNFNVTSSFFNFDSITGLFILIALFAGYYAHSNPKWWYVLGAAVGLGVMTKNVVGLLPLLPIGVFYLVYGRTHLLMHWKTILKAIMIALLIVVPWHVYESIKFGRAFWDNYLGYHVFHRFNAQIETNGRPFGYFFGLVFHELFLDIIFIGGLLLAAWFTRKQRVIQYLLFTFVSIFLLLSFSQTKLPGYISVVLPVLSIVVAIGWLELITRLPAPKYAHLAIVIVMVGSFIFVGKAFNDYKLAEFQANAVWMDNRTMGLFFHDNYRDLPLYVNRPDRQNIAMAVYADRAIPVLPDYIDQKVAAAQLVPENRIKHTRTRTAYDLKNYILIVEGDGY